MVADVFGWLIVIAVAGFPVWLLLAWVWLVTKVVQSLLPRRRASH